LALFGVSGDALSCVSFLLYEDDSNPISDSDLVARLDEANYDDDGLIKL